MIEWVLLLFMNGYITEYSVFPNSRECDIHMKTITQAFKQSGTNAYVRCEERVKKNVSNR